MKLLALLALCSLLASCSLPFARSYSLGYSPDGKSTVEAAVRFEAAPPKRPAKRSSSSATCPHCQGTRRFNWPYLDPATLRLHDSWHPCPFCDGTLVPPNAGPVHPPLRTLDARTEQALIPAEEAQILIVTRDPDYP